MERTRKASSPGLGKEIVISAKFHGRKAFAMFEELRSNSEFCDVVVQVKNLSFHAHGIILAGVSPFFRQELSTKSEEENVLIILPEGLNADAARSVLVFIYTGELTVSLETVQDLLTVACMFQLDELVQAMAQFIVKNLSTSNCLVFRSLSSKLGLAALEDKISRFIDCNFKRVVNSRIFPFLSAKSLLEIIKRETLQVKSEEVIYEAVWKWYNSDIEARKDDAEKVFGEIQFDQISPKYIADIIIPDLVEGHSMCKELVRQALNAESGTKSTENRRKIEEVIYVISGRSDSAERFDPVTCAFVPCNEIAPDTPPGENRCAVTVRSDLYVISTSKVEKFNVSSSSWETVCTGVDVRDASVCAGKEAVFVVGGRGESSNKVYKLEIKSYAWRDLPEMKHGRRCPGATVLSGKLYAIGGYGETEPMSSVERFDFKIEKWAVLKPLNGPRFQHGVVSLDGKIFVVGGRDNESGKDTVEVYDPKEKTWQLLDEKMNEARNDFGIVSQGKSIYCVGGRGVRSVEYYSLAENEWKVAGRAGQNNFCISCVSFPPV